MEPHATSSQPSWPKSGGILRLEPAWVARDFLPPGRRLGLHDDEYEVGERGRSPSAGSDRPRRPTTASARRMRGSATWSSRASDHLEGGGEAAGDLIMGAEYARRTRGWAVSRRSTTWRAHALPHPPEKTGRRKLGSNPKEEAYYFPEDVDLGPHPETFFGVHPYIVREGKQHLLLPVPEGVEGRSDPSALPRPISTCTEKDSTCHPGFCMPRGRR